MIRLILPAICLGVVLVGCDAGDSDTNDSTATAAAASAAGVDTGLVVDCVVDPAATRNRCLNVLLDSFPYYTPARQAEYLKDKVGGYDGAYAKRFRRRGHNRDGCNPADLKGLTPSASTVSRDMPKLDEWKNGAKVVLLKVNHEYMNQENRNCTDTLYNIGGSRYDRNAIAYLILTVDKSAPGGVGRWEFVVADIYSGDTVMRLASRGQFTDCRENHNTNRINSWAAFGKACTPKHLLLQAANRANVGMEGAVAASAAASYGDSATAILSQNLRPLVATLVAQNMKPESDEVWFTCALGCCTAENPEYVPWPGLMQVGSASALDTSSSAYRSRKGLR